MAEHCIIIPVYNHGRELSAVLQELTRLQLPFIIVNDGSEHSETLLIQEAANAHQAHYMQHPINRGKGAALKSGLQHAAELGFTHALQIDADGQHDLQQSRTLLELSRQHPQAVINGEPQFGRDAPVVRRIGRWLSIVWVWIETLSFTISDTMCGFRAYPVTACNELLHQTPLSNRMAFDTEILVRLHWRGIPVIMCPVAVHYPSQGRSHFRMLDDNLRHIGMHLLLVLGMLLRLPQLIWRKCRQQVNDRNHWTLMNERGSSLGMRTLIMLYRLGSRHLIYALLFPVTLYLLLTHHQARQASCNYFRHLNRRRRELGQQIIPVTPLLLFRHFYTFAVAVFDKTLAWIQAPPAHELVFPARTEMLRLRQQSRGALVICSHLGYSDIARAVAHDHQRVTINILVYHQHALKYNTLLRKLNPDAEVNIIHVNEIVPELAIQLRQKIQDGEMIFIAGDRTPPNTAQRSLSLPFLGQNAAFPQGPAVLAHVLGCPVYFFFCLRRRQQLHVYFEHYSDCLQLSRRQRDSEIRTFMSAFVRRLEVLTLSVPCQWFNFFDFWQQHHKAGLDER